MTESDPHKPQIYQLRVMLRGISPLIWRRLLVHSESTVAQNAALIGGRDRASSLDGENLGVRYSGVRSMRCF
jgi:hypothetical protein